MRIIPILVAGSAALALAACDNRTDDVVQAPVSGGATQEVTEDRADIATSQAALALGMSRSELEGADIVNAAGDDLGDVESLVIDAGGNVTHLVVDVDVPGDDVKVLLPIDQAQAHVGTNGDKDLRTTLTSQDLVALPKYQPPA